MKRWLSIVIQLLEIAAIIWALSAAFAALVTPAHAATVDRAPSGAIVTVRPGPGEQVVVLSSTGRPLAYPTDAPDVFWVVNPDAWKQAVVAAEQLAIYQEGTRRLQLAADTTAAQNADLQVQLESTRSAQVAAVTRASTYKAQRWKWALAAGGGGLLVGAGTVLLLVF